MKLAIDCRMSGKSGIGTFLDGLLPHFCNDKNIEYILLGDEKLQSLYGEYSNVDFVICNEKPFSLKEMFLFPKNIVRKINSCNAFFTPYCNIPSGIHIPIFTTIHDIIFLDIKGLTGFVGTLIRKLCYKYAIYKSSEIFTVSEFSRSRIINKLNCKKPIHIAYNGLPSYLENEQLTKKENEKENFILFVGNIKKHKGLSVLMEAFLEFSKEYDCKLVIVGDKENFRTKDIEMENLINTVSNKIIFTGRISNEELHKLLLNAKMLVQPSFYEGFGIPPLEALKCGTNAVISDIPVFKEIYSSLPVYFFKTGDSKDLLEIMDNVWNKELKNVIIPECYSYKASARKILQQIVTFVDNK